MLKTRVGKQSICITIEFNTLFLAWYKIARTHPYLIHSMEGSSPNIFLCNIYFEEGFRIPHVSNSPKKN